MTFRLGRLRIVDLLLFASGALQLHLLFDQAMFTFDTESGTVNQSLWAGGWWYVGAPTRWLVLITGVLALLVLPLGLIRRSAASALATTVGLVPLAVLSLFFLTLVALFPEWTIGWARQAGTPLNSSFFVLFADGALLLLLAVLSLRSEGRGFSPDAGRASRRVELSGPQTDSQSL